MRALPTAGLTFVADPAVVSCTEDGRISGIRHPAAPQARWLLELGLGDLVVSGRRLDWGAPRVTVDTDEVEVCREAPGFGHAVLRHSFAVGWTTRLVLANDSDRPWRAVRLRLRVTTADGCRVWALATGSAALLALVATDGRAPVLGARVTAGAVTGADADGLLLGPIDLGPGDRFATQLQWHWARNPRVFTERWVGANPRRTVFRPGEALALPDDPDTAVLVEAVSDDAAPAELTEAPGQREVVVRGVGRYRVGLRSSRGSADLDVRWAPPPADLLRAAAEAVLAGPRTRAGVVRIDDVGAAVLVQHALAGPGFAAAAAAAEALDRFTARADPAGAPRTSGATEPLLAVYLAGEHDRLGEPELLDRAVALLDATGLRPGLGIAAVRVSVALLLAGRALGDALRPVIALAGEAAAGTVSPAAHPGLPTAGGLEVATTELRLATLRLGPARPADLQAAVIGLGRRLGAGLPGQPAPAADAAELAHLVAVLRLVPDELRGALCTDTGYSADELAERVALGLSDRLRHAPPGPAHTWLALADQPA